MEQKGKGKTPQKSESQQQKVVNANDTSSFGNLNRLRNIDKTKKVESELLTLKTTKSTPSLSLPQFKPNMAVSKTKPTISAPIIQYKPKTQTVQQREQREVKRKPPKTADMLLEGTELKREKRVFNIDEIAPTALEMGLDAMNLTHPVTLPFLAAKNTGEPAPKRELTEAMQVEEVKPKVEGDIYQREIANAFDQQVVKTSVAENLFRANKLEGSYYGENELLFFQFPSIIPFATPEVMANVKEEKETTERMKYDNGFANTFENIKEGKIGKLYILKSGQVKLRIGECTFNLSQGMPCGFLQELHSVDLQSKEIFHLGDINKRVVVSPDIEDLIQKK